MLHTHHQKAIILGDGGASKAVQAVLDDLAIPFIVVSRKGEIDYEALNENLVSEHKLIIQTTPVGMYPLVVNALPFPYHAVGKDHLLYDLIYNPEETVFLKEGKGQGAEVKNGLEMLKIQAEYAWKLWSK